MIAAVSAAYFAHGAFEQARIQAEAAVAANAPFVYKTNISTKVMPRSDKWGLFAAIQNGGNSVAAAVYVQLLCGINVSPDAKRPDFNLEQAPKGILGPKQQSATGVCPNVEISKESVDAGSQPPISLYGEICFKDIVKNSSWHLTRFSNIADRFRFEQDKLRFDSIIAHSDENCVDEDCTDYPAACQLLDNRRK